MWWYSPQHAQSITPATLLICVRHKDVGSSKAEVAAQFVRDRCGASQPNATLVDDRAIRRRRH